MSADAATTKAHQAARIKEAFRKYDTNGDGSISFEELHAVLKSLGGFRDVEINAVFSAIDVDGDGKVQFNEFVDWVSCQDARGTRARVALAPCSGDDLQLAFVMFCGPGSDEMDCRSFTKMCKDMGFIEKNLTVADTDLIFSKVVSKGKRRINLAQFESALRLLAERRGLPFADARERVIQYTGPSVHGTRTDSVRLHDDRSTYTGTRRTVGEALPARAIPSSSPRGQRVTIVGSPEGTRSRPRTCAGTPAASPPPPHSAREAGLWAQQPRRSERAGSLPQVPSAQRGTHTYKEVFRLYCGNQADIDAKGFTKLCRECRLLDDAFVAADADLIFVRVVDKGQRRMHIKQFEEAVYLISQKKDVEYEQILEAVAASSGPTIRATLADAAPHLGVANRGPCGADPWDHKRSS